MEKKQTSVPSLKAQSAWLLLAKIVGFAFSFLLPLFVVRLLTQTEYGLYQQSFKVIGNAAVILPLGFSMSAYYFLSRETERRAAAISNILLFNFTVGGLACLTLTFYPQLLGDIFSNGEMTRLAPRIGIVIWIWIFSTFLETVAIANQEARLATVFIILAQFTKTLLMVSAVFIFTTVEAFLYAAMIQGTLQTVILLVYLNSRFPRFWTAFDLKFLKEQAIYALPFGFSSVLWVMQTDVHNYFVGHKFTSAEYAIYAAACFEVPLIAMLAESVTSVLIPRMSELQKNGDTKEMIRLTARAMQKLSLFYFPIYVFLMITAQTFIITLFTRNYLASVPIFMINLTILPFSVLITDPIVRAYKELGRFLLILRIFIIAGLIGALYFGLEHFDLRGMILVAVVSLLAEKFIAQTFIVRRIGFGAKDFHLLKNVGKTSLVAVIAGIPTYLVYSFTKDYLLDSGEHFAAQTLGATKLSILNFVGGSLTLLISALVFFPVYIAIAYVWGIIEDDEKENFKKLLIRASSIAGRFTGRSPAPVAERSVPNDY